MKHAVLVCLLFPNDFWAIDRTLTSFDDPKISQDDPQISKVELEQWMSQDSLRREDKFFFNVLFVIKAPL